MNSSPVSRRRFLRQAATTMAVAGAVPLALHQKTLLEAADPPAFRLRWILGSLMYGRLPLETILPEVKKTGAEFIDLWPPVHGDQRKAIDEWGEEMFLKRLKEQGVKFGMTTRYDMPLTEIEPELRLIKRLDGKLLVVGPGGRKNLEGAELKSAAGKLVESLKPAVAVAEETGIGIAVENHSSQLLDSVDGVRYFAELSPSNKLGIALAPYHLPQDAVMLGKLIEELGPKLLHFYAWQHGNGCMKPMPKDEELLQLPGRGPLDFKPMLAALKKIDYRGWTEIFMHTTPRGKPILDTVAEVTDVINQSRLFLEKS